MASWQIISRIPPVLFRVSDLRVNSQYLQNRMWILNIVTRVRNQTKLKLNNQHAGLTGIVELVAAVPLLLVKVLTLLVLLVLLATSSPSNTS